MAVKKIKNNPDQGDLFSGWTPAKKAPSVAVVPSTPRSPVLTPPPVAAPVAETPVAAPVVLPPVRAPRVLVSSISDVELFGDPDVEEPEDDRGIAQAPQKAPEAAEENDLPYFGFVTVLKPQEKVSYAVSPWPSASIRWATCECCQTRVRIECHYAAGNAKNQTGRHALCPKCCKMLYMGKMHKIIVRREARALR